MEENNTKKLKHYPKNPKGKWICKCGGPKQWASTVCKACQLADRRPPIDPVTYYDEEGRPYRRVPCIRVQYALVSAHRYEMVMAYLWVAVYDSDVAGYYAITGRRKTRIRLHNLIAGRPPHGKVIDHINHDTLDCRDHNLREADESQSMANQTLRRDNKSGFKGVWYRKERDCWCGMVTWRGKHYFTKHCKTAREAAIERNNLAVKLHGEFAYLNKIPLEGEENV